ncbi:BMC domain-containing protein [Clostridium sardiniense]|uniref:BMC domain-containing protein n=1 Tax=Clostridium sardiniense TaxID=29369 RepID=A0ABS7KUM6_CLOSR|nr:BMC domain-containing protein [Clostridium sardiniense]MBY0754475.1 BMC domain-containing protein [Clostridium sardiniense]MDQ0460122.1 ethanolamine utilization microcompartment shell protein EutS [Clostridium sardiniense]
MYFRLIKSPTEGTKRALIKRMGIEGKEVIENVDAIGLAQGKLIDMIYAIDIAEKAAGVVVEDIKGVCPQHMTSIAILGDTSSVQAAIEEIKLNMKEGLGL